jgi:hypothetical protein
VRRTRFYTPRFTFNNSSVDYTANPRTSRAVNVPQIIENVSYVTGAHVIRLGVNVRMYQHNDQRGDVGGTSLVPSISLSRATRPPAGFTLPALSAGTTAGISATDLNRLQGTINDLLGIPASLTQVFMGNIKNDTFLPFKNGEKAVTLWAQGQRTKQYNFFAQDEWKLRKNVSISYGVRWELNGPPTEAGDRVYVPNKPIDGSQGAVSFVHAERWYQNWNTGALAPRLGVTWSPGSSSRMVVRAGYGIAFDPISTFQVTSIATAAPGQTYTCSSTLGSTGAATTTPGCDSVPNIRLADGFPNELPLPPAKPSTFLTPPLQLQNNAPAARLRSAAQAADRAHVESHLAARAAGRLHCFGGLRGPQGRAPVPHLGRQPDRFRADFAVLPGHAEEHGDRRLPAGWHLGQRSALPGRQRGAPDPAGNSDQRVRQLHHVDHGSQPECRRQHGRAHRADDARAEARPNQQFAQILYLDNGGDSVYHALQVTFRKRFDRQGLLLNGGYTFSKSIDDLSIDPVGSTTGGGLTTTASRTPADARN